MSGRKVLSTGVSGYLDFLRFGAAFVVLLSHFAYPRFTDGRYSFIRELNLGSDAVVLFFVLSGFVITFAATQKDKTGGRFTFSRLSRLWSVAVPALSTGLLIGAPVLFYILFQVIGLPGILRTLTYLLIGPERFSALGFSDEFMWNALIGALFTVHLFGMGVLLANRTAPFSWQNAIKWLAGGSFSLYLVHYPVLQWGGAVIPRSGNWVLDHAALLTVTCLVCYGFAAIFERPLARYRKVVLGLFSRGKLLTTS